MENEAGWRNEIKTLKPKKPKEDIFWAEIGRAEKISME
jgi:hypothetical protein